MFDTYQQADSASLKVVIAIKDFFNKLKKINCDISLISIVSISYSHPVSFSGSSSLFSDEKLSSKIPFGWFLINFLKKLLHRIVLGEGGFICLVTARDMQEYKIGITLKVLMSQGKSHQIFDQISRFHDDITYRIINVIITAAILTRRQQNLNCTKHKFVNFPHPSQLCWKFYLNMSGRFCIIEWQTGIQPWHHLDFKIVKKDHIFTIHTP